VALTADKPTRVDTGGSPVTTPRFVGREAEREVLAAVVGAPPSVVVVEGEAGIGKTRLLAEVLQRFDAAEPRVLVGGCRHIREPFPLGPVVEAVRSVGDALRAAPLSPVAGALRPLLPELSDVLPPLPAPLDDRQAEQHRVFRGLVELLDSLGSVVLVLEDLHWADERTVDFVTYLLGDPRPRLSLVLTFRGEEVGPAARAMIPKLPVGVGHAHLVLSLLDERETGELAAAILGLDRLSDEFAAYLCERASGLPFAIEELLALLRTRGALVLRGGEWARRAVDELDVPRRIKDQVGQRVSSLSSDARAAAEAAAVLQVALPMAAVLGTSLVDATRTARGIDEAVQAGLLVVRGETLGFRHLLASQATYEEIPELRRRELHARAATTLESQQRMPLGMVAHHLRCAGRVDEWVDAAERAADQAIELGHDDESVRLLQDVLRDAPLDADRRGRIAVKVARAAVETLKARDVISLLTDVLEHHELPRETSGELRFRLALLVNIDGGDPAFQRRLYLEAIEELDDRADLKAWAMTGLAAPTVPGLPVSEQKDWLHRTLELIPRIGDSSFEVFLLGKVAMVLAPMGDPAWRGVADRIIERTDGSPARRRELNACYSAGFAACYVGQHERAELLLSRALEGAIGGESYQLAVRARAAIALLDFCRASWEGLAERVDQLVDEHPDHAVIRTNVEVVRGCLALPHGELDAADARLTAAVALAEGTGAFDLLPLPVGALVRLQVARGRVDAARASAERYFEVVEPIGVWAPVARALPAAVEALVAGGESDTARRLTSRWARRLGALDSPLAPAALAYARGVVGAAEQRWRRASDHFVAAAEAYESLSCPYEAAQSNERAAAALLAVADPGAAERLQASLAAYGRLGATWDLGRAARTARRHGIPVPSRHRAGRRGYGSQLSPREREVAELAATGRTNKEIGAELFLSVSTVEKHVRAVSRKLGVRSRAAIARVVSEGGADVEPS
jgi:DNA-binding NarL/FixJ family response regulator